jgi:hypothetical protein
MEIEKGTQVLWFHDSTCVPPLFKLKEPLRAAGSTLAKLRLPVIDPLLCEC